MELKDFVQQTLVQIIEGVKAAQGKTGKGIKGEQLGIGVVNPELSRQSRARVERRASSRLGDKPPRQSISTWP